jgi:hypothetical protein
MEMSIPKVSLVLAAGCGVSCLVAMPLVAEEAEDWKSELAREQVEIKSGKMVIEGYDLCKVGIANLQLRTYSEAPHNGSISRDNFFALTTASVLAYQAALGNAECKHIKAPIGAVDLELSIHMTEDGMKQEYRDHRTNTQSATTGLWSELLAN